MMKRQTWALAPLAALGLLLVPFSGRAQTAPPYRHLPTASEVDGRMFSLGGRPLETNAGETTNVKIVVPAVQSSFEFGIFDGDTGKNAAGALDPITGRWDGRDLSDGRGNVQLIYRLYADPDNIPSPTDPLIAQWFGNDPNPVSGPLWTASSPTMPDNDWWSATVQTTPEAFDGTNFTYRLEAQMSDNLSRTASNFKVRARADLRLSPDIFGVIAAGHTPQDRALMAGTYDGTFSFFFNVPPGQIEMEIWDADADLGGDTDDPDTGPAERPDNEISPFDLPEGVNPGNPADSALTNLVARSPVVRYVLTAPDGSVYVNNNPSGNREWESYRIATAAASGDRDATVVAPTIPSGLWEMRIEGLDVSNLTFLKFPFELVGVVLIGDLVFEDSNANGVRDSGERGLANVGLTLVADTNRDGIVDFTRTTVTDANGNYLFAVPAGGSYRVLVNQATLPAGLTSMTFNGQEANAAALANLQNTLLTVDFGFTGQQTVVVDCPKDELWPPDGRMVNLKIAISGRAGIDHIEVWSNEDDETPVGNTRFSPDVRPGASFTVAEMDAAGGIFVRRERVPGAKPKIGRIYLVLFFLRNGGVITCPVYVPASRSAANRRLSLEEIDRIVGIAESFQGTPEQLRAALAAAGYFPSGDGRVIGRR